ncbi:MAG TPA: ArsA-related P-loop ATPase [Thermoanaerobaculia bacterium]|nr:ArsA-related P-loop ATPase [Thermoanaerobaculia bacterium]
MELISDERPLTVVVGAGGVGKTTLAAALGVAAARAGRDALVVTFDPSHRLKDALGVADGAAEGEAEVPLGAPGRLAASLLDPRRTFDRLVERYAPDAEARRRILDNRFYRHLAGSLGGILEYMAVERLYELAAEGRYAQVVLDTPPTRQALDFLEAPARIVAFLDSGVLRVALRRWFDAAGRLRGAGSLGPFARHAERLLDEVVGLDLLRDMNEFFQAFAPLYEGFRERAAAVQELLRSPRTRFLLVAGAGEDRIPDTLFFARRLEQAGYHLAGIVVNRVHPWAPDEPGVTAAADAPAGGRELLRWLGRRDRRGLAELAQLLPREQPLVDLPLLPEEPGDLEALAAVADLLGARLAAWSRYVSRTS